MASTLSFLAGAATTLAVNFTTNLTDSEDLPYHDDTDEGHVEEEEPIDWYRRVSIKVLTGLNSIGLILSMLAVAAFVVGRMKNKNLFDRLSLKMVLALNFAHAIFHAGYIYSMYLGDSINCKISCFFLIFGSLLGNFIITFLALNLLFISFFPVQARGLNEKFPVILGISTALAMIPALALSIREEVTFSEIDGCWYVTEVRTMIHKQSMSSNGPKSTIMTTSVTKIPSTPTSAYNVIAAEQPPVPRLPSPAGSPTDPEVPPSRPADDVKPGPGDGTTPLLGEPTSPKQKSAGGGDEETTKVGIKSAHSMTTSGFGFFSPTRSGGGRGATKARRDSDSLVSVAINVNLYLFIPFLTEFMMAVEDTLQNDDPYLQCVQSVLNSSKGMWTLLFLSRDPTIVRTLKQAFGIRSAARNSNGPSKFKTDQDDE
ncbi:hypothetical protein HDU96_000424 [Phlyctochytrium bullatum]|nr:hypothetical protein HDU96_000424 [Phlyctochytrium bullatum]